MKVLYDDIGFREPHGGVSRYFTELMKHLRKCATWEIAASETYNEYLEAPPFSIPASRHSFRTFLPGVNFKGKSVVYGMLARLGLRKSMELQNERMFLAALLKGDFDVLHLTGPHGGGTAWRKYRGKAKVVVTIHDLIPDMTWGGARGARVRSQRKYDLAHCDAIIAVSKNTKRDLVRMYGVDEEKVTVVYHGFESAAQYAAADAKACVKYVLYVGKRCGYKNSDFFLREMAPLLREDKELRIVMTGRGLTPDETRLCRECGIDGKVEARFFPDEEMPSLYANARCFVYPSRYEGFGIPILESFAAGCPAVLANASCFPEVGGDAALYFDADDGEGMRRAVREAMGQGRDELVRKGRQRVKEFTWDKCAERTLAVYGC